MSVERKGQQGTPDRDDYDISETPSTMKVVQEDEESSEKVFNDPIHGHIELHPLLVSIIDTRQFQRLRHIKQLGGGYYVFPGASHNRFEHSLGVCYLAGEFVESLQHHQEELEITKEEILCIKIAGLCHDLGHGPFSHLFDGQFIRLLNKGPTWKHEQASVKMLQYLIDDNNLWPQFKSYNLTDTDLTFIKELIDNPLQRDFSALNWPCHGRPINRSFLYEIVANKRNGVDVDKWDYFARDCHCLGIRNAFDWRRYMKFARVIEVNGIYQICCRDKEAFDLFEMFHTRNTLHRKAYKHKTVKIVEEMITEALVAANEHYLINGKDGHPVKMSEAIHDMVAYTQLTDSVIQQIMMSSDPHFQKAQQLLRQIEERKLYKCIGETQPITEWTINELTQTDIKKQIVESVENCSLTVDDLLIQIVSFDYGMDDENPIDHMRFYIKSKPNEPVKVKKDQVSRMLPETFCEKVIRLYCKNLDKENLARKCYMMWCNKQKDQIKPRRGDLSQLSQNELKDLFTGDFTPYGTPFGAPVKDETDFQDRSDNVSAVKVKKQLTL